jgi:hypothetical protein
VDLRDLVDDFAEALVHIDASRECFRTFKPGVGPYGEPQLVKLIACPIKPTAEIPRRCAHEENSGSSYPK